MALKTVLENLEGVDDALKSLYKENDGKFVLHLEAPEEHPVFRSLKNAHEAVKSERNDLKNKVSEFEGKYKDMPEDFDPAKWIEYKAAAAEAAKDGKKKDEEVQRLTSLHASQVSALEARHQAELKSRDDKVVELDNQLDNYVRDTELTGLLVKAKVDENLLDGAKLVVGRMVKTERAEDGKRRNIVETDIGPVPLENFVKTWAETDGQRYLARPGGVDAPGSKGHPGGKRTVSRAEFDKMPAHQRNEVGMKAAKGELVIVD